MLPERPIDCGMTGLGSENPPRAQAGSTALCTAGVQAAGFAGAAWAIAAGTRTSAEHAARVAEHARIAIRVFMRVGERSPETAALHE